ncbi:MAG: methyltransferase domain-containing protein, partial [Candidatus Hodarchaeota archaeon]
ATEAYKPNIPIAKKTLEPLGVTVVEIENGEQENAPLPFEDNFFDLVINRHECYETKEVYRILKPGGVFVNQQVGYRNNETLRLIFASTELGKDFLWNLKTAANHLKTTTFKILKAMEHIGYNRFYDIRSFIYLLKVLPWEFPDFSIERYENQLFNVYVKLINEGFLDSTNHRFFIIAQKTE